MPSYSRCSLQAFVFVLCLAVQADTTPWHRKLSIFTIRINLSRDAMLCVSKDRWHLYHNKSSSDRFWILCLANILTMHKLWMLSRLSASSDDFISDMNSFQKIHLAELAKAYCGSSVWPFQRWRVPLQFRRGHENWVFPRKYLWVPEELQHHLASLNLWDWWQKEWWQIWVNYQRSRKALERSSNSPIKVTRFWDWGRKE